jgi:hypothetical protein
MVEAGRSVLLELMHMLGEYREHMVVIGGWVPNLILPEGSSVLGLPHIGSTDIDLVIDHANVTGAEYATIEELLREGGYHQTLDGNPNHWFRKVTIEEREITVKVEFSAGMLGGTGRSRRHQRVQGVLARKQEDADLALLRPQRCVISGRLPSGAADTVEVPVASLAVWVILKSLAIRDRIKEKDPYDLYFCLKCAPQGLAGIARDIQDMLPDPRVRSALESLATKFASLDSYGPASICDFQQVEDPGARELLQRDAFEHVNELLKLLGIT